MSRLVQRQAKASGSDAAPGRAAPSRPHIPRPPWSPAHAPKARPSQVASGTGLPDRLRAGIEALSGLSMDDVRVYRNSPEPPRLGALAYAQGSEIHLAPGQERHLPHEAWHVVQQKQGRVKPTVQLAGGKGGNDEAALETEANRMGAHAAAFAASAAPDPGRVRRSALPSGECPVQRRVMLDNPNNPLQPTALATLTNPLDARLTAGGLAVATEWLQDAIDHDFANEAAMMTAANTEADNRRDARHAAEDTALGHFFGGGQAAVALLNTPIPPELQGGLNGLAPAAAARCLFENVNRFPFRYIGAGVPARVAFAARQGDCGTLVLMYELVAQANQIPCERQSIAARMLVAPQPIHGRSESGNTHGLTHWYFSSHHWVRSGGTAYDLLFMKSPPPVPMLTSGSEQHDGVTFYTFPGGLCVVEPAARFGQNVKGQGRVFESAGAARAFIDRY